MLDFVRRIGLLAPALAIAGLALAIASDVARARGDDTAHADWTLTGVVVYTLEIPNSGGAWAVTIARERPGIGGSLDYLLLICDHEQEVTADCAALPLGAGIEAAGLIVSNEPYTGQRLSVRSLALLPMKRWPDQ